jgi:protein-L-isoaspartate(D-aspartate) O-methyltransferase
MIDFERARRNMVECQIRTNDVTDARILDAMTLVAREDFVPVASRALAYLDKHLPIGDATPRRHLIEPNVLARLIQAAEIGPEDVVLDVGCGTGYSSAIMARLAGSVVGLESEMALATEARRLLVEVANVAVVSGALEAGYAKEGPYDVILLEGAVDEIPTKLVEQMKVGSRIVAVLGAGRAARAVVCLKGASDLSFRSVFEAALPPLFASRKEPVFEFPLQ